jgi:glycyl-tRNA synthetase
MTVLESLRQKGFLAEYDDSGSIGRRYARADEVGTPYCVTIDHQTLEDDTVTVRDRDTTAQVRVGIEELPKALNLLLSGEAVLQDVGVPVRS